MLGGQIITAQTSVKTKIERRRKPGSDLVLILISFRDGFHVSFARAVLAFATAFVS